jgi:type IV secretion system protein VirB1
MMPSPDMMQTCAPGVAPETVAAIIQVESGGNPFAVGVNGPLKNRPRPKNYEQAITIAKYYMAQGYSVDMGLMQINSTNLRGLGQTVESIFDPCNNLKAGTHILKRGYAGAVKRFGPGQDALKAALSAYNTGNYERGFKNGYVKKYYKQPLVINVTAPPPSQNTKLLTQVTPKPIRPINPLQDLYTADPTVSFKMEDD